VVTVSVLDALCTATLYWRTRRVSAALTYAAAVDTVITDELTRDHLNNLPMSISPLSLQVPQQPQPLFQILLACTRDRFLLGSGGRLWLRDG